MSKIKNGGLDQYGVEPFEQQQFGTAGVEGVNRVHCQNGGESSTRTITMQWSSSVVVHRSTMNLVLTRLYWSLDVLER